MKRNAEPYFHLIGRIRTTTGRLPPWEAVWRVTEAERIAHKNSIDTRAAALSREKARLFDSLSVLDGCRSIVGLFRCPYDCHNAKTLLKGEWTGRDVTAYLSPCGGVPTDDLFAAIHGTRDVLPVWLENGIAAAQRVYRESRDTQRSDAVLDRACFAAQRTFARESGCAQAEKYVRLLIDAAESGDPCAAGSAPAAEVTELSRLCETVPYGTQALLGFLMQLELRHHALCMEQYG